MAKIIDGTYYSKQVLNKIAEDLKNIQDQNPLFKPRLAIVQVGNRKDSNVYIRNKILRASEVGIDAVHIKLSSNTTQIQLEKKIDELNNDDSIDGIIIQLPLDSENKIDSDNVIDQIKQCKDVDGLTRENAGRLMRGELNSTIFPCTPYGCLYLVREATGDPNFVSGKNVVVVGRSKIVGSPAAALFMWSNATTTICHSKTVNLKEQCLKADILIVAIGQREFIKGDYIKPGAIVIDCGINFKELLNGKSKLCGDVDFESAKEHAAFITPVPGGVGPMTVAMLIQNTFKQAILTKLKRISSTQWNLKLIKLNTIKPVPNDSTISQSIEPKEIEELASEIGILKNELELYGSKKAKISLKIINRLSNQPNGNYIVVTGITPTPFGEGKSTTVLGLVQALNANLQKNAIACIRQPSQGPTFGIKGGAAGGGYSQVVPMDDFNLHLTGDIHAITAAHNLLAAAIDARIFHEETQNDETLFNHLVPPNQDGLQNFTEMQKRRLDKLGILSSKNPNELTNDEKRNFSRLDIDKETITWNRVLDVNDRFLRSIQIGLGSSEKNKTRFSNFKISVASELMSILALCNGLYDLQQRIQKIIVAYDKKGNSITVDDVGATGALTVLLKDAIKPTLIQTIEGTPVLVHTGPFANISHGNSSIIADQIGLKLVGKKGFVVTEAGFGADIGFEKFINIKCRVSNFKPNVAVIVVTIRALKMHGGGPNLKPGETMPSDYLKVNLNLVRAGCYTNLKKQIENVKFYNIPIVVCINRFQHDYPEEIKLVLDILNEFSVIGVVSTHWENGGKGAIDLAKAVNNVCNMEITTFRYLYDLNDSIEFKIKTIAQKMYGASDVIFSEKSQLKIKLYNLQNFSQFPICMAKTHSSLSDDPSKKGAPTDFSIYVNDIEIAVGAGFIYPLCGTIVTMPGLNTRPRFFDIDIDPKTELIVNLF